MLRVRIMDAFEPIVPVGSFKDVMIARELDCREFLNLIVRRYAHGVKLPDNMSVATRYFLRARVERAKVLCRRVTRGNASASYLANRELPACRWIEWSIVADWEEYGCDEWRATLENDWRSLLSTTWKHWLVPLWLLGEKTLRPEFKIASSLVRLRAPAGTDIHKSPVYRCVFTLNDLTKGWFDYAGPEPSIDEMERVLIEQPQYVQRMYGQVGTV